MRLLFAISVASFCTVLWIALSLARRIERDRLNRRRPATQAPTTEFFEAGQYRTPRPILLNQQVASTRDRPAPIQFATQESSHTESDSEPVVSGPVRHLWPSGPSIPPAKPDSVPATDRPVESAAQSRQIIDSTIQLVTPRSAIESHQPLPSARAKSISAVRSIAVPTPIAEPSLARPTRDISGERKLPQAARSGEFRRVDLSHYNNEDMGDLTDPYTHIARPSGIRRAAKTS